VIEQQVRGSSEDEPEAAGVLPLPLAFGLYGGFTTYSAAQRTLIADLVARSGGRLAFQGAIENHESLLDVIRRGDSGLLYLFSHGYTPFQFPPWLGELKRKLDKAKAKGSDTAKDMLALLDRGEFSETEAWIEVTSGKLALRTLYRQDVEDVARPLVLLNMCRSAQVMPGLSTGFVQFFLYRARARGVLGTECPISPVFADAFARELLPRLLAGSPLGAALREARQALLDAHGNPLGLAYTLWGSALAKLDPTPLREAVA
jgi:hypothetical protein